MSIIRRMNRIPFLGGLWRGIFRLLKAAAYYKEPIKNVFRWLITSKETTNFTYDLTPLNTRYLASYVSIVTNREYGEIMSYIEELIGDDRLRKHVREHTQKSDHFITTDPEVKYCRRIGWYAIARAIKPEVLVETGVDKGLGACVLTAALIRNSKEGYPGRYYGTEINPEAGYLLRGEYAEFGEILWGDSIESLKKFDKKIDMFINDSDHSESYEEEEYRIIRDKLNENAYVIADNAHCNSKLLEFSIQAKRKFLFFKEEPRDHWYPGAGIGVFFKG